MNINKLFLDVLFFILVVFFSQRSTRYGTLRNRRCVSMLPLFTLLFRILFCTTHTYIQQDTRFCVKKQSFKMFTRFTDIFPTVYIEAQK